MAKGLEKSGCLVEKCRHPARHRMTGLTPPFGLLHLTLAVLARAACQQLVEQRVR